LAYGNAGVGAGTVVVVVQNEMEYNFFDENQRKFSKNENAKFFID